MKNMKNFYGKYYATASMAAALSGLVIITNDNPVLADTFTGITGFSPTTLNIPGGGFAGGQTFMFNANFNNTTSSSFNVKLFFQIVEKDPVFDDVFNFVAEFMKGPGVLSQPIIATLTAAQLNSADDLPEGGQLEFAIEGVTATQTIKPSPFVNPNPVPPVTAVSTPEPISTLGLLALGSLGAASTLKRKLKPSQSTEKETTKVC